MDKPIEFNFDEIITRRGTGSLKWDAASDAAILPMWIADMDFRTAPAITEALANQIAQGIFGYPIVTAAFYQAIISWWLSQYQCAIEKQWIVPAAGTAHAINAAIRALTKSNDGIIVQTPVYNQFFPMIENCGCRIIENELINIDGHYEINFEDLELKASDANTTLLILCNPHNPLGRVWTKEELISIASICAAHNVAVLSDEVYADLSHGKHLHQPFLPIGITYGLRSVTCSSPGKPFNLSGLQIAYAISSDQKIADKIGAQLELSMVATPNLLAITALIAAYTDGEEWLKAVKDYIYDNYLFVKEFCERDLPIITVSELQAGYLVWLDCLDLSSRLPKIATHLLKQELWLNDGSLYGLAGEGFLRMNIACPRLQLQKALLKLKIGIS